MFESVRDILLDFTAGSQVPLNSISPPKNRTSVNLPGTTLVKPKSPSKAAGMPAISSKSPVKASGKTISFTGPAIAAGSSISKFASPGGTPTASVKPQASADLSVTGVTRLPDVNAPPTIAYSPPVQAKIRLRVDNVLEMNVPVDKEYQYAQHILHRRGSKQRSKTNVLFNTLLVVAS